MRQFEEQGGQGCALTGNTIEECELLCPDQVAVTIGENNGAILERIEDVIE